ncbi:hypothetical protein [Williamsia sp. CHRR-6]|uniref:hypothetical protein n=1 Tax=Williamsia sp. CHRR-6 TaxID=2835871 RepID=UPI001BD9B348|nr:hypothetical protein [Williamsia sp. CHRR-6]MBT0568643.1 hypothetical protein [Williamsia sp. CHRR-6]
MTVAYLTSAAAWAAVDIARQTSPTQTVATVGVALLGMGWAIALHRSGHRFVHAAARRYAHELFKAAYTLPRIAAGNPPTAPRLAP